MLRPEPRVWVAWRCCELVLQGRRRLACAGGLRGVWRGCQEALGVHSDMGVNRACAEGAQLHGGAQ